MELPFAVACLALGIALCVWATQWGRVRQAEIAARLKQDMLARGLSVDEIERLTGGPPGPNGQAKLLPAGRASDEARAVAVAVESMVLAEKEADEIAAFLDAFLRRPGGAQPERVRPTGTPPGADPP